MVPEPAVGEARHLLGESLGNGAGVGDWSLLLRGQLLIHSEGVVIYHKGHQQGQEPGDQLGFLGGRKDKGKRTKPLSVTSCHLMVLKCCDKSKAVWGASSYTEENQLTDIQFKIPELFTSTCSTGIRKTLLHLTPEILLLKPFLGTIV